MLSEEQLREIEGRYPPAGAQVSDHLVNGDITALVAEVRRLRQVANKNLGEWHIGVQLANPIARQNEILGITPGGKPC